MYDQKTSSSASLIAVIVTESQGRSVISKPSSGPQKKRRALLTDAGVKVMGITGSPKQQGCSGWNQGLGAGRTLPSPSPAHPCMSQFLFVSCPHSSRLKMPHLPATLSLSVVPGVVAKRTSFIWCLCINPRLGHWSTLLWDICPPLGPISLCCQRMDITIGWSGSGCLLLWPEAECVFSGGGEGWDHCHWSPRQSIL